MTDAHSNLDHHPQDGVGSPDHTFDAPNMNVRAPNSRGHDPVEHQIENAASVDEGLNRLDNHITRALIDEIIEQWKERQDHHGQEKALTLRIKARCRRFCSGSKTEADTLYRAMLGKGEHELSAYALAANLRMLEARGILEDHRKSLEKRLETLAKDLPVYDWWVAIMGAGALGLAGLVGEAGDLSNYSNPAKLWKRMGLAVLHGERQRKVSNVELALEHGYAPHRRSLVWNIGDSIIKAQSQRTDKETGEIKREAGEYRLLYDARKEYELPRVQDSKAPKGHAHSRAKRYMEKRLLRDLWRAWRDQWAIDSLGANVSPELEAAE